MKFGENIKLVPHIAAPLTVAAADLITLKWQPTWNEWASYIMTAVGYIGGAMDLGPSDFLLNVGVASLPLTARHLYERIGITGRTSRMAFRPAPMMPSYSPIRQTTVPEFADVKIS